METLLFRYNTVKNIKKEAKIKAKTMVMKRANNVC